MLNLDSIRNHYELALGSPGDNGQKVGWRNSSAQLARFNCIFRLLADFQSGTIADVGCGTGDLLGFLRAQGWSGTYSGVDISAAMIQEAAKRFGHDTLAEFALSSSPPSADFVVASGIFNVSLRS